MNGRVVNTCLSVKAHTTCLALLLNPLAALSLHGTDPPLTFNSFLSRDLDCGGVSRRHDVGRN